MIFDTHAHYDDPRFDGDRDIILNELAGRGIGTVVDVSASFEGIEGVIALAERYPFLYATVGVHPSEVAELTEEHMAKMAEWAKHPRVVAIGEIGLDYHYLKEERSEEPDTVRSVEDARLRDRFRTEENRDKDALTKETDPPRDLQKKWFRRQLALAKELDLPVVIHSRDASQDTLDIMREAHRDGITGVIHCFSGSVETAKAYLKMGYYIGVGGVVTFKNGRTLREVVRITPIEQILIETDCPYLAPEPYRGKRNDSRYLPYVVRAIAEIKELDEETVIRVTEENARRVYRLKEIDS